MLASQSRALKARIRVKKAKNIWDKKWPIWREPGPENLAQKAKTPFYFDVTMENPKPNTKKFFF